MSYFQDFNKTVAIKNRSRTVESVEIRLVGEDFEGQANVTDLMLQGGKVSTVWVYHPTEIRWSHDG